MKKQIVMFSFLCLTALPLAAKEKGWREKTSAFKDKKDQQTWIKLHEQKEKNERIREDRRERREDRDRARRDNDDLNRRISNLERDRYDYDRYNDPRYPGTPQRPFPGGGGGTIVCSPSTQRRTVARVDSAAERLQADRRLAHESRFHTRMKEIAKIKNTREKSEAYLNLAGVRDPSDNKAVADLLNPKADPQPYLENISNSLDINDAQAKMVYEGVRQALLEDFPI